MAIPFCGRHRHAQRPAGVALQPPDIQCSAWRSVLVQVQPRSATAELNLVPSLPTEHLAACVTGLVNQDLLLRNDFPPCL